MKWHLKLQGSLAVKKAAPEASPVLLEPTMKVEVTCPEEFTGDVIGDINGRRGRMEKHDADREEPASDCVLCRWQKCSGTRMICVPKHKAVRHLVWNLIITNRHRRTSRTR